MGTSSSPLSPRRKASRILSLTMSSVITGSSSDASIKKPLRSMATRILSTRAAQTLPGASIERDGALPDAASCTRHVDRVITHERREADDQARVMAHSSHELVRRHACLAQDRFDPGAIELIYIESLDRLRRMRCMCRPRPDALAPVAEDFDCRVRDPVATVLARGLDGHQQAAADPGANRLCRHAELFRDLADCVHLHWPGPPVQLGTTIRYFAHLSNLCTLRRLCAPRRCRQVAERRRLARSASPGVYVFPFGWAGSRSGRAASQRRRPPCPGTPSGS